jgi:hypothetical protein
MKLFYLLSANIRSELGYTSLPLGLISEEHRAASRLLDDVLLSLRCWSIVGHDEGDSAKLEDQQRGNGV